MSAFAAIVDLPGDARSGSRRRARLRAIVLLASSALTVLGILAWPMGLWRRTFERFGWYPLDESSLLAVALLIAGIWCSGRSRSGWRRYLGVAFLALAALVILGSNLLEYVLDDHVTLVAGEAPDGADPNVWGHPNAAMSVIVLLVSVAGLVGLQRRGRATTGALLSTSIIIAVGLLASTAYSIGLPVVPDITAVVGPSVGLTSLMVSVAAATNEPDLPPMTWLANRTAAITLTVVGLNLLLWPALFQLLAAFFRIWSVGAAQDYTLVTFIVIVLLEAFLAAQLLADRDRWNRITEFAADGVLIVDANGRIVEANARAGAILAGDQDDLIDRPLAELVPSDQAGWHDDAWAQPADAPPGRAIVALPTRGTTLAGDAIDLELNLTPIQSRGSRFAIVSIRDISRSQALEREYAATRELLADATDLSLIGQVLVKGPQGTIVRANGSMARMLGYRAPEDLVGKTMVELTSPDDLERLLGLMVPVTRGEVPMAEAEHGMLRRDGSLMHGHVLARYLIDQDGDTVVSVQVIDVSQRVAAELLANDTLAELTYRSTHDLLTGLPNRGELIRAIDAGLARSTHPDGAFAVMYLDIDNFKFVNDEYSHEVGDQLLRGLTERIGLTLRPTDLLARVSGDEFAAVIHEASDAAAGAAVAQRVIEAVAAEPFATTGGPVYSSISAGLVLSRDGMSAEQMLQEADIALLAAKEGGRSTYRLFDGEIRRRAGDRLAIAQGLNDALAAGRITAEYQPIVNLRDGSTVGFEALARWQTAGGKTWPAQEWIDVADEFGLLSAVGERVMIDAIARLAELPTDLWVAVNVAGSQLSPDSAHHWLHLLETAGVRPDRLAIELLERSLMRAPASSLSGIGLLADAGVRIFFDDFGSGSAPLSTLQQFRVTGVKMDRAFTASLGQPDAPEVRWATALATMAAELDLESIAEGVETADQAVALRDAGWMFAQGWYFGAPQTEPSQRPGRVLDDAGPGAHR